MSKSITLFFSIVCGLSVANIYYNQPLLVMIAADLGIKLTEVSYVSFVVQVSYACGLIIFVPLADKINKKTLIIGLLAVNSISQIIALYSYNLDGLILANILIGLSSVTAQIVIPIVSMLSTNSERGKNVATVMSGLFTGILLARIVSGYIGHNFSWREMYLISSILNGILILIVAIIFPKVESSNISYLSLIKSMIYLVKSENKLKASSVCGAISFSAYSALWSALAYLLSLPPYSYSSDIVGLFGLVGVVGVTSSRFIGTKCDQIGCRKVVNIGAFITANSFIMIYFSWFGFFFLIIGMALLDIGGRSGIIGNQMRLFDLPKEIRSRLNTIYMFFYFIGGAIGSKIGPELSVRFGWGGIATFGISSAIFIVLANKFITDCNLKEK